LRLSRPGASSRPRPHRKEASSADEWPHR
jgi:hypothetical protein